MEAALVAPAALAPAAPRNGCAELEGALSTASALAATRKRTVAPAPSTVPHRRRAGRDLVAAAERGRRRRRQTGPEKALCGPPATLSLLNGISSCHIWTSLHACMPDDIYPCLYDRTWYELISVFFWPTSAPTLKGPPSLTPERARHTSYPNKMNQFSSVQLLHKQQTT